MTVLSFLNILDDNLSKSLKEFKNILSNSNINEKESVLNAITLNNKKLYTYLELLKELEEKCLSSLVNENVEKEIFSNVIQDNNFKNMFKNNIGMDINAHKLKSKKKIQNIKDKVNTMNIDSIDSIDISPHSINIPIIDNIKDIPPMFYWYNGDNYYKSGIYTCISPGFYSRVPFPNTNASNSQNFKVNTMPCKYTTKAACIDIKRKNSNIFHSEIRECSYLHSGEKFIKIGMPYRCNIESFGNHSSLDHDMNFITINDIKRLLMYSLSDSLLCNIWYQNKFKNGDLILSNIETYIK